MHNWNVLLAVSLPLRAGDFVTSNWKMTVTPLNQTVEIAPPSRASGTHEGELKEGTPGWRGPLLLPGPAWVYAALRPETLVATLASDPATTLQVGRDFALDPDWAAVAALPGSAYAPGTKVHFSYQYALARIDLIECTPDGKLVVVRGAEDKSQPHLPAGTPGNTPLASVVLPNHATALTPAMVHRLNPDYDGVPPVVRRERLAELKQAMEDGKAVTIVFFGDSITAQASNDFRDGHGSFVERFTEWLRAGYPKRTVVSTALRETVAPQEGQTVVVMSGVGGNDTIRGVARLDTDVLVHKPDLVVVMFGVNDENRGTNGNVVPVPVYRTNLETIVERVRGVGGDVLLMTPSMKNPGWVATVGNMAEYAQAMREVAEAKQLCLIDHYRAWERLPERGYSPMVFVGNCINHPVDLGHELFFRGLRTAFSREDPPAPPPTACACPPESPAAVVSDKQVRQGADYQDCVLETGKLHSPVMHRDIDVAVLLPPAYAADPNRRFPVLFALHGMGAPFMSWADMAPLRKALANQPMVVVMFNGDRAGWYIDAMQRPRSQFTTFFFEELAPWVDRTYRTDPARRGATGFSMGANGAFHYMLSRPDFFVGVSGLSSGFNYFNEGGRAPHVTLEALLGPGTERQEDYRRIGIRRRLEAASVDGISLPPLFLGCGTEDRTLEACRTFRDTVTRAGHRLEYAESPGGHAWPYWRDASTAVIDFHWRTFQGSRRPAPAKAGNP